MPGHHDGNSTVTSAWRVFITAIAMSFTEQQITSAVDERELGAPLTRPYLTTGGMWCGLSYITIEVCPWQQKMTY